ncbi:hypothetical protein ACEPAI_7609 [Sanghuangporus weigelae]
MAINLPKIIYGTAWKKEATKDLVVTAVLQGFTAIDTGKQFFLLKLSLCQNLWLMNCPACQPKHYREDLVGKALEELYDKHGKKREDLWLQTKFTSIIGQDRSKPLPYDPSLSISEQVRASFQTSLRNLHTSYLDSYILHSPLPTRDDTLAAWNVLNSLKEQGKVHMIGVSNAYQVSIIELLDAEHKVEVVQNRWYQENDWDKDVVKYCKEHGVMYQSFWTLTGSPSLLKDRTILKIAETLQCTPAQVIFRLAQLNGATPLAGSKNPTHMKDGVTVEKINLDQFLSDPKMEELQKLLFK